MAYRCCFFNRQRGWNHLLRILVPKALWSDRMTRMGAEVTKAPNAEVSDAGGKSASELPADVAARVRCTDWLAAVELQ